MSKKEEYLEKISQRGDHYGDNGGLNSLLAWCKKVSLQDVTEEEAGQFLRDPNSVYEVNQQITDY